MHEEPGAQNIAIKRDPKLLSLEKQVWQTLRKFGMLQPGEHVLVAVSGGADSNALLLCLHRLAPRLKLLLTVAHLNHGIRGGEGDADEEFVRRFCTDLGLRFISEKLAVREWAAKRKKNLEEAAREMRYAYLKQAAVRIGAQKIAVGHTLNDQAETVLLRFFRGSGVDGLCAIHPVLDGLVVRPLLECTRENVLHYLEARGAPYREDSSNRDLSYRRNRLRYEWIPSLERNFNPRLLQALGRGAEIAREVADYLDTLASGAYDRLRSPLSEGVSLPAQEVLALHPVLRALVLRHALRESRGSLRGISARHIQNLVRLCRPGRSGRLIQLPGRGVAARQFHNLLLLRKDRVTGPAFCYELPLPGQCIVREAGVELLATVDSPDSAASPRAVCIHRVFLDRSSLPNSLIVRSRLPGDRYGGPRHRKVKKMLIDAKVGLHARSNVPMVVAGDAVVWIPGFKPAKNFTAHPESSRCVVLEVRSL